MKADENDHVSSSTGKTGDTGGGDFDDTNETKQNKRPGKSSEPREKRLKISVEASNLRNGKSIYNFNKRICDIFVIFNNFYNHIMKHKLKSLLRRRNVAIF